MLSRLLFFGLFLLFGASAGAQSILTGRVFDGFSETRLGDVSIYNKSSGLRIRAAIDGTFSLEAKEGDSLIFTRTGFVPDTVRVSFEHLLTRYDVNLQHEDILLKNVTVTNSYGADSLARRNYYSDIYRRQAGLTGYNTPSSGFGIVLSPGSFFSGKAKQKRRLKKRLEKEEEEKFIDYSFPQAWVERMTGLKGDSLSLFLYRYRPSYDFCRRNSRDQMLVYVNDSLKEFRKPD